MKLPGSGSSSTECQSGETTRADGNNHRSNLVTRFWSRVDDSAGPDECWPWRGCRDRQGYGIIVFVGRPLRAHRVCWAIVNGSLPDRLLVRHWWCGNPPCVNPAHLLLGTIQDNSDDMVFHGRSVRGERMPHHKLTDAAVIQIRALDAAGEVSDSIARRFGVGKTTVQFAILGRTWAHLPLASRADRKRLLAEARREARTAKWNAWGRDVRLISEPTGKAAA